MFRIKICGLTNPENARQVLDAGADAIGLNFFERGTRYVAPTLAREIGSLIPSTVAKVGVFVNSTAPQVLEIARSVSLDFVQLHGDEPPELAVELVTAGWPVIRALRCHAENLAGQLKWLAEFHSRQIRLAGILVDAAQAGHYGGTGQQADWSLVERIRDAAPGTPLILAGGLTPANVAAAIRAVRPDAVDTASGVEAAPGQKSPELVRRFVAAARDAFESIPSPASHRSSRNADQH